MFISPKATDKPNVAINICQKYFWYRMAIAKMAFEYAYWPITTEKVIILPYNSCSGSAGIKLSFDDNARKVLESNYTSTIQSSILSTTIPLSIARIASKRWQYWIFTSRDDSASFSAKLRSNVDNSLFQTSHEKNLASYVETVDFRHLRYNCVLICHKIASLLRR